MKKTTLQLSNRLALSISLSALTFSFYSKSFSQTTEAQKSTSELRAIEVPQFANETERQEWISKHPEEYHFLIGSYKEKKVSEIEEFPKFIETGNYELDILTHQKRKDDWINKHPEEYKRMQEQFIPSPEQLEIMNSKTPKSN